MTGVFWVDDKGDVTPADVLRHPDSTATYFLPPGRAWSTVLYHQLRAMGIDVRWATTPMRPNGELFLPMRPPWNELFGIEMYTRGGMSEIYIARHPSGHDYVVKVIPLKLVQRLGYPEPVIARLHLEGVYPIEAWATDERFLYLLMLKADGTAFHGMGQCLRCLYRVTRALANLHARGWVHCDVKPSNIFILKGQAYLADPGIAVPIGQILNRPRCSLRYAPPEWIDAFIHQTPIRIEPAADVYALALTALYLWTGLHPYPEGDRPLIFAMHADGRVYDTLREAALSAPLPASDIFARCFDPDPSMRPDAAEIASALPAHGPAAGADNDGPGGDFERERDRGTLVS